MVHRFPLLCLLLITSLLIGCTRPAPAPARQPTPHETEQAQDAEPPAPLPTAIPPPTPTPLPTRRILTAEHALMNGDWEAALAEYELVLESAEQPELIVEAKLGIALSEAAGRNDYAAIEMLESILRDYPKAPQIAKAHFALARAYDRQERFSEAAAQYQSFLSLKPGVIDAYLRDLRADSLFAAGDYSNASKDYQAALEAPSVKDEIQLRLKLARSYAVGGDNPTALALYDDIYQRTQDDYTKALVDLRKGQIFTELGQIENAQAAYLDAVNNYPKSYDTYSALVALVEAGVEVNELQRGIIDYYARQYGPAAAAFDHYLQANPEDPGTARYFYGLTSYAQGNYTAAIQQWEALIENFREHPLWDEAWEQKAYTQWANLGLYDEAVQTLVEFSKKAPGDPRAAEFIFDAGLVAERDGQLERAIGLWESQASTYPDEERATRARFLAALARYRLKEYGDAALAFQRYLGIAVSLEDKAAGHFWNGKSLDQAGDAEGAKTAFETAAGVDPTGYYSERARDRLRNRQAFEPPQSYDLAFDLQAERNKAAEWVKTTFDLGPEVDLSGPGELVGDAYLRRGLELWELGLYDEARGEFEVLRTISQSDPARTFRLANLFLDLGAYRPAVMAARQVLNLAGMDDAGTLSAPVYFNHIRFGTYYSDLVMPLAQEYGFHPLFLFALIRQESLFEGFVSSSAGARGLMQIVPSTGEEIAANLGWPENFSPEDLYRPVVSLRLGVDYLDRQREHFDGDLYTALAAYNGGPGNAAVWKEISMDDPDLFAEIIRYEETRSYIRRIYENFAIYRVIYDRTP